jgi:Plasmid pRiA4b ORF-3-like protein
MKAYVFEAKLVEYPDVSRRLAVRGDQRLEDLHEELRRTFEWWEDHVYSFWLDGEFWGDKESEYTSPIEPENGVKTADVELADLELEEGHEIAYVFDFGDEWRVRLRLDEVRPAGDEAVVVLETRGKAPPQHAIPDEEELGAGD